MTDKLASIQRRMPKLNLSGAFIRRTNLRGAILREANLTRADLSFADLRDVDFEGAIFDRTVLVGADLRGAKNLKPEQIERAVISRETKLPDYIKRETLRAS